MTSASLRRLPENSRGLISTIAFAAAAGASAVAFLWLTNVVFRLGIERLTGASPLVFAAESLGIIACTSLASGALMHRFAPDSAGSGVPQLKAAYWKDLGFVGLRATIVKFVAGILTLGGGTSLGREGPSVFVGGGVASNLAAAFGVAKTGRRGSAASGAAAALAAAFNTPLAAITFVIEEMLNNEFGSRVLGGVVLSAVLGALIVQAILGPQPAFSLPSVEGVSWLMYVILPLVAAAAALIGVAFHTLTLFLRSRVRRRSRLPTWMRPVVGALMTWSLGCAVFFATGHIGVFGLGYGDLSLALNDHLVWQVAGVLVIAKFAATVTSYAWGGCGGIFSPTLFLGGLTGLFIAGIAGMVVPLTSADRIVLAAVGMSACFNAVVRAPLTGLLIVFEMTHQFAMVPPLMVCMIVSQAIARLGGRHNFYEALLLQDGHELIRIKPPRDIGSWQKLPVEQIARSRPIFLSTLAAPDVRRALEAFPFQRFPVGDESRVHGIVTRREMTAALEEERLAEMQPAHFCGPRTTVHDVGALLMDSPTGLVLLRDPDSGRVLSMVTLHDLLRAQAALSE